MAITSTTTEWGVLPVEPIDWWRDTAWMPPTAAVSARHTTIRRVADAWRSSTAMVRSTAVGAAVVAIASGASARVSIAVGVSMTILVVAALVDVHERRLPNRILALAMVALVAALFGATGFALTGVVAGAAACAVPVLLLHLVAPASMGFGDVKLSLVLGSTLGTVDWRLTLWTLALGSAVSAVVALVHHQPTVAFGPGLVGAAIALIAVVATSHAFQTSGS